MQRWVHQAALANRFTASPFLKDWVDFYSQISFKSDLVSTNRHVPLWTLAQALSGRTISSLNMREEKQGLVPLLALSSLITCRHQGSHSVNQQRCGAFFSMWSLSFLSQWSLDWCLVFHIIWYHCLIYLSWMRPMKNVTPQCVGCMNNEHGMSNWNWTWTITEVRLAS